MVQEANITTLDNDSYLLIVYGKDRNNVSVEKYKTDVKKSSKDLLNNPVAQKIANVVMAGYSSPIAQNIASKALPSAVLGRINSSIYDIMADGKINVKEVAEDFIGSCTNTLDNIATDLGFPTPSALYSAVMPSGMGVISKDFTNFLAKKMDGENKAKEEILNQQNQQVSYIKLQIVTDDSESLPIGVVTRKTEKGFNIPMAISNENKTKSFEVKLINSAKSGTNMYQLKSQLEELRDLKEPFDVYINDKDVLTQYKLTNCLFSDLNFKVEGRNAIACSISITENPEWDIEIVKLEMPNVVNAKGKNQKSGIQTSKKSLESKAQTTPKQTKAQQFPSKKSAKAWLQQQVNLGNSPTQIAKDCAKFGLNYNETDIQSWLDSGQLKKAK